MELPKNVTMLEVIPDYTGLYRTVKFTGDITYKKWLGLRKTVKNHLYVAFGKVGSWMLVNVDGHTVKVPVHQNSFIAPLLDLEILNCEYKKSFKFEAKAVGEEIVDQVGSDPQGFLALVRDE